MSPPEKFLTFEKYSNNIVEFVLVILVFLLINVMGNIWFDILQFILWYKSLIYWSSSVRLSPFGFRPISWNVFSIIYTPPFHQIWREKDLKFLHDNQLPFFFAIINPVVLQWFSFRTECIMCLTNQVHSFQTYQW